MDEDLPVSLNDWCIMLLESVIAENRRLRETIEARDTEQQQLLQLVNLTTQQTTQHSKPEKEKEGSQFHNSVV